MTDEYNFNSQDEDEIFNTLLEIGALVQDGFDDNENPVYLITDKLLEIYPELYHSLKGDTDRITLSLWKLGILDIEVAETYADDKVSFNQHNLERFIELEDTLDKEQIKVIDVFMDKEMREAAKDLYKKLKEFSEEVK